jgi:hypothetical protein
MKECEEHKRGRGTLFFATFKPLDRAGKRKGSMEEEGELFIRFVSFNPKDAA